MFKVFYSKYIVKENNQKKYIVFVTEAGRANTIDEAMMYAWKYCKFDGDWKDHIEHSDNDDSVQYSRYENKNMKPLTNKELDDFKAGKIDAFCAVYEFEIEEIRKVPGNEIKDIVIKSMQSKFSNN